MPSKAQIKQQAELEAKLLREQNAALQGQISELTKQVADAQMNATAALTETRQLAAMVEKLKTGTAWETLPQSTAPPQDSAGATAAPAAFASPATATRSQHSWAARPAGLPAGYQPAARDPFLCRCGKDLAACGTYALG